MKSELIYEYFLKYWQKSKDIDNIYGPRYDKHCSLWFLGDKQIDLNNDNILVAGENYVTTQGLLNLIFLKEPAKYSPEDKSNYEQILAKTNAHKDIKGRLRHQSTTNKYLDIIRPMFTKQKTKKNSFFKMRKQPWSFETDAKRREFIETYFQKM